MKKIAVSSLLLAGAISGFALGGAPVKANDNERFVSAPVAELASNIDVQNLQYCSDQIKLKCDQRTAFAIWRSCVKSVLSKHGQQCQQSVAIFNALGAFPWQVTAAGPVTVVTIKSVADGINTYYMIDNQGRMISLVDDRDDVVKNNADFKAMEAKDSHVGMMGLVDDSTTVPQINMKKDKQGKLESIQIVFPEEIKSPGCVACQTVAIADMAYNFDGAGNFVNVTWLNTTHK